MYVWKLEGFRTMVPNSVSRSTMNVISTALLILVTSATLGHRYKLLSITYTSWIPNLVHLDTLSLLLIASTKFSNF